MRPVKVILEEILKVLESINRKLAEQKKVLRNIKVVIKDGKL